MTPIRTCALILALVLPLPALADAARTITVTGSGEVQAEPDMAVVSIGARNTAPTARAAMDLTAAAVTAVMARLTEAGIEPRDMQTGQVALNPVWDHRGSSENEPRVTGFEAAITLTVRVRDLSVLGGVLDAAVSDGANALGGLSFALADPAPLLSQARAQAVADAKAKAEEMAAAAGVTLGPVQTISEQGSMRPQPMMMEMARSAAADMPIAAGEVGYSASVMMVFAIAE
jgi:uncharacterized protein YggE